ncbi:bleomycin hydrolase [Grosmannia clavigera kw1407]|uniref:Bleomycin hydrolase n=1 Tax=Grosmannia clavigera (strain kw1407 / UAMH 11150) TaxID=655863 RepID=F0XK08_GROCL|nr:bleomycin hydrolase [Grosmannia clavigera kw1407]EFX01916.1 bleomycin hydrolase [Grosmannia clavigera kw1407]
MSASTSHVVSSDVLLSQTHPAVPASTDKKKRYKWRKRKTAPKTSLSVSNRASTNRQQTAEGGSATVIFEELNLLPLQLETEGLPYQQHEATSNDLPSHVDGITIDRVEQWGTEVIHDNIARLAMLSVSRTDVRMALLNTPHMLEHVSENYYFGLPPAIANAPLPNHQWCGRPYLFAGTSLARLALIHKYNLQAEGKHVVGCQDGRHCTYEAAPFELSQAYLFFWDRLEKCGHFLDRAATCPEMLLWTDPLPEGGSWTLVQRLVEKYGLLPADVYPGSAAFAAAPHTLDQLLATTLRENAAHLMGVAEDGVAAAKEAALAAVFRILAIVMGGPPPSPRREFTWHLVTAAEQAMTIRCTPRMFAQDLTSLHFPHAQEGLLSRLVCIAHDPRNSEGAQLIVGQTGGQTDPHSLFRPHSLLNTSMADFKMACECMLKAGYPVFIGCDAGRANSHADVGLLDVHAANFELAFGRAGSGYGQVSMPPLPRLSKADRLRTGDSRMTHALVVTGIDVEAQGSQMQQHVRSRRWRVQRTLRTCASGHDSVPADSMLMTDAWMEEFVYLAVVDPYVLPERPMGATMASASSPSSPFRPYRGLSSRAATLVRTTTGTEEEREAFAESTETVVLTASDPMAALLI